MTRTFFTLAVKKLSSTATACTLLMPAIVRAADLGGFSEIEGGGTVTDPAVAVRKILFKVLTYVGLIAVVVIVIAGIYLITSNGEETQKDKAKKIIIYTIVGLVIIALASVIVIFIIAALS